VSDTGKVAAVDIGTNSVRLLILDGQGQELAREMTITRLGQGVDVDKSLHPEAIARTTAVLERYAASIAHHGVARVRATATSAARDANNSADFFDAVQRVLGVRPELLSGEQEAALSFAGATAGLRRARGPFLVLDIGGGSTELVLGLHAPEASISLQLGCVRMSERYLHSDPPSTEELAACTAAVAAQLPRVHQAMDVTRARCVIGTAGTVTTIAGLSLGLQRYDASRTHHLELTRQQVYTQLSRLQGATVKGRRAMLAEPGRAEVIVGGAVVLATLMRELDIPALLVSELDILDGLALSLR